MQANFQNLVFFAFTITVNDITESDTNSQSLILNQLLEDTAYTDTW